MRAAHVHVNLRESAKLRNPTPMLKLSSWVAVLVQCIRVVHTGYAILHLFCFLGSVSICSHPWTCAVGDIARYLRRLCSSSSDFELYSQFFHDKQSHFISQFHVHADISYHVIRAGIRRGARESLSMPMHRRSCHTIERSRACRGSECVQHSSAHHSADRGLFAVIARAQP